MRTLPLLLLSSLSVVCLCTKEHEVRASMYQIQGVILQDEAAGTELENNDTRHSAHIRRRRDTETVAATNAAPIAVFPAKTKSEVRRQAYESSPYSVFKQQHTSNNRRPYQNEQRPSVESDTKYYYPQRMPLPLPKCFHNPTGYVCCNEQLNDLIVDTYTNLEQRPKFHACNVQLIATHLQLNAQKHFNTSFETLVGYEDFAQKIHFRGDMVCKVELGGRYMLAYATASDRYNGGVAPHHVQKREVAFDWGAATDESWSSIHSSFI